MTEQLVSGSATSQAGLAGLEDTPSLEPLPWLLLQAECSPPDSVAHSPLPVSASILPRPYLWQTKPLEFLSLRENSTVSHADADRHYKNQSSTVSSAQHGTKESLFQEEGYL